MKQKSLVRLLLQPLAIAVALAALARLAIHFYVIPSSSMAPTLMPGDRVVVTRYWPGHGPERGHVIVFRSPADGTLLVKRVVATAGEYVDSEGGRLRVGGHALAEPYVSSAGATGSIQPQLIPQDCYFVLGDNREVAVDSRTWGPIARERVVGRARIIVWRSEASESGVSRVFKWIR